MIFTREDILKIQNALLQLGRKDSEFKDANTPLNSDDYIAILQDGINKKVSINNLLSTLGLLKKDDFINVSDRYDEYYIQLSEAITIIANNKRKKGLVITFQDIDGNWKIYQFTDEISNFIKTEYWKDLFDFKYPIVNSILPDEEDLTLTQPNIEGNSFIQLKDKEYDPQNFSGMATKILRKHIVEMDDPEFGKVKKNILYQNNFNQENCIYEIKYDFDLNGQEITIPNNCVLKFIGGSISNGIINFSNSYLLGLPNFINIISKGIIKNNIIQSNWFNIKYLNNIASLFYSSKIIFIYGTYYINNPIQINSNIKIIGKSNATLILDSSTLDKVFYTQNTQNIGISINGRTFFNENITISNIVMDYNRSAISNSPCWIKLTNCYNCNINNLKFIDNNTNTEYPKAIHIYDSNYIKINNNYSEYAPLVYAIHSQDCIFEYNIGLNIFSTFIEYTESYKGSISHNTINGNSSTRNLSILSSNSKEVIFKGNYIDGINSVGWGINIGHPGDNLEGDNNTIIDNIIKNCKSSIFVQNGQNVEIIDNILQSYDKNILQQNSTSYISKIENNEIVEQCTAQDYLIGNKVPNSEKIVVFKNNNITFIKQANIKIYFQGSNIQVHNNTFINKSSNDILISLRSKNNFSFINNIVDTCQLEISTLNLEIIDNHFKGTLKTAIGLANASDSINSFKFIGNDYTDTVTKNTLEYLIHFYYNNLTEDLINNITISDNKLALDTPIFIKFRLANLVLNINTLSTNSGNTDNRPNKYYIGYKYFDTTLNKPIYWDGTKWIDAIGNNV